jgi:hypothetical protein
LAVKPSFACWSGTLEGPAAIQAAGSPAWDIRSGRADRLGLGDDRDVVEDEHAPVGTQPHPDHDREPTDTLQVRASGADVPAQG